MHRKNPHQRIPRSPFASVRTAGLRAATLGCALLGAGLVVTGCRDANSPRAQRSESPAAPEITLDAAIINGDDEAVRAHIIAGTPVNTPNASGDTPLSLAAVFGRAYAAKVLVDAGADLEARNNTGTTPLFNGAFFCHPDVVRVLIDAGADTGTTDANGFTIREVMETPWAQVEPIYSAIYGAIGMPFDAERIRNERPRIAEMLR